METRLGDDYDGKEPESLGFCSNECWRLFYRVVPGFCADNRCFLVGGGSAENFFVSESATVGSIIGKMKYHHS